MNGKHGWELVPVGPDQARIFLSLSAGNRKIKQRHVEGLARDMKNRRWREGSHQGMAFNASGKFTDGHHRCHAIILSGVTIKCWVFWGESNEDASYCDTGLVKRNFGDCISHDPEFVGITDISPTRLGPVTNKMYLGVRGGAGKEALTEAERREFFRKHKDAILWACGLFRSHKAGLSAGVVACFARARYTSPVDRLMRAAEILETGEYDSSSEPEALTLIRYRKTYKNLGSEGGIAVSRIYCRFQRALKAFLDGEVLQKIYPTRQELFPLPPGSELTFLESVG